MSADKATQIDTNLQAALGTLVRKLADNKAAMGRRYGEWAVSAPTLESAVAAAAMAQDELGHARSTYPVLKQLGLASAGDDGMDIVGCLPLLAQPLDSWEMFVAVNLVIDGMLTAFVRAARDSNFIPLAERARKILQEERSHEVHARAWTRRLASGDAASREAFSAALTTCWTAIYGWAGEDQEYGALCDAGLVGESPEALRTTVRQLVLEALDGAQLPLELA